MSVIFISSPDLWKYRRRGKHPAVPDRLEWTFELLSGYRAFDDSAVELVAPRLASSTELARFHTREYIEAVRAMSEMADGTDPIRAHLRPKYGFGTGDNPVFPGMYEAAALRAGGALQAAEMILGGKARTVFHYAGGQHHARPARTAGFCIFNDAALACFALADRGRRVAYVDIDAHHGDGVQYAFYSSDRVLTISFHESGASLYPGTGFTSEAGLGAGAGYNVNMPFLAGTGDETYLDALRGLVPRLIESFQPDVLVTELGADGHWRDPLSHLNLTTRAYVEIARALRDLGLPWLALGGGGYDSHATARAWTLMFGEMVGHEFADGLPREFIARRGGTFLRDREGPEISTETRRRAHDYARARLAELDKTIPMLK
jgi:acetoin utilization protein AcuC